MLTEMQMESLSRNFMRIFALPISRLTILEVRNALNEAFPDEKDKEKVKSIFESLLNGNPSDNSNNSHNAKDHKNKNGSEDLDNFLEKYSPHVRFAREVADRGEFMNTFNCEFLQQGNQVYFVNRMRRLDGEEYYFLSAPETNVRLAHMFINRLRDLKRSVGVKFDPRLLKEIENIKNDADSLLN